MFEELAQFYESYPVTFLLVTLISLVFGFTLWRNSTKGDPSPPGPFSWPFVGHMPYVLSQPEVYYEKLREKYGDVFGLYLGTRYTVIINGHKLFKEAVNKEELLYRPPEMIKMSPDYTHLADMNGLVWKENRRFLTKTFSSLGVGKTQGAEAAQVQIASLIEKIRARVGEPNVEITPLVLPFIANSMFRMVCGLTFEDDPTIGTLIEEYIPKSLDLLHYTMMTYYYPWRYYLGKIFPTKIYKDFEKTKEVFENFLRSEIKRHEENAGPEKSDLFDYYAEHMRTPGAHPSFTKNNLIGQTLLFLSVGVEPIRLVFEWFLHILSQHHDIQDRMHREIVDVVGTERLPNWDDRMNLPYTQAVIQEVFRWKTFFPINDPRWSNQEVKLGDYVIPKDAVVLLNAWSVHHDPEIWGDPSNLRPERFLTSDGKSLNEMVQYNVAFSIGKRNCIGEKFTYVQLFLFLSSVIQHLQVKPGSKNDTPGAKSHFGEELVNLKLSFHSRIKI